MMSKKKIILIFSIVIIILLVIVIISELQKKSARQNNVLTEVVVDNIYIPNEKTASSVPRDWEETESRKEVPVGVKVPEANEVVPDNLKDKIAVPVAVVPVSSSVDAQIRLFKIRGEGGKFVPEKIIANLKDTVHIEFTAVDRDYDIIFAGYNLEQTAKQGQTKVLEFQALQDGRFPYYCPICGGSAINPQGEIIIVK